MEVVKIRPVGLTVAKTVVNDTIVRHRKVIYFQVRLGELGFSILRYNTYHKKDVILIPKCQFWNALTVRIKFSANQKTL